MYEIIEDASPYYIRFKFFGLEEIIKYVLSNTNFKSLDANNYIHKTYFIEDSIKIIDMLPMSNVFNFRKHRVASFLTPPGKCSSIHKDGKADRVSFNIPLTILDDKCLTSWYHDLTFNNKEMYGTPYSRIIFFNKDGYKDIPKLKTLIAKPNEILLFNTDIFHSWENNQSSYEREVLTFRLDDQDGLIYFDDAKKKLFKNTI
jgi:hypothetical protein